MTEYVINFSGLLQRPYPISLTKRNVRITGGDDLVFVVTMYADEDAIVPVDITDAVATMVIYRDDKQAWSWDYGLWWLTGRFNQAPILQIAGLNATTALPTQAPLGQIYFMLPPDSTAGFHGRFVFQIVLQTSAGFGASVLKGIIDIDRAPVFLTGTGSPVGSDGLFVLDGSVLDGPDVLR